jgi:predicted glycoside hydrolase/deacetylase ChbG (UPF0249 family)
MNRYSQVHADRPPAQRKAAAAGALIVNADDWGENRETTDRTLECIRGGAVSSVSAMMFMEDSERAATIAREGAVDAGLHLNLSAAFTAPGVSSQLAEHQRRVSRFLRGHRYAQTLFHPLLIPSFEYSVAAQIGEYVRLFGHAPRRIDGHHHMHLCPNVVIGRLLPQGVVVRRNFSFGPGEKSILNRAYRRLVDRALQRRHTLADFLFSLPPLEPAARLQKIFTLAREFAVEVETHPTNPDEYRFLAGGEIFRWAGDVPVASAYALPARQVMQ